jgi:hypothetical protein
MIFNIVDGPIALVAGVWLSVMLADLAHVLRENKEMPIAVATDVAVKKMLKSLPADPKVEGPNGEQGWVKLRRMTYGEKMHRRTFNSKMTVKAGGGKSREAETVIDAFNEKTDLFDFATCIVDHNLQGRDGSKLDFRDSSHVKALASHVAEEIQTYMDELNNFEQDEEAGNS